MSDKAKCPGGEREVWPVIGATCSNCGDEYHGPTPQMIDRLVEREKNRNLRHSWSPSLTFWPGLRKDMRRHDD